MALHNTWNTLHWIVDLESHTHPSQYEIITFQCRVAWGEGVGWQGPIELWVCEDQIATNPVDNGHAHTHMTTQYWGEKTVTVDKTVDDFINYIIKFFIL